MMKTAIVALLMLAAPAARAEVGYVDLQRVINETDEGKAAAAGFRAETEAKQKEQQAADADAAKLKTIEAGKKRDRLAVEVEKWRKDIDARQQKAAEQIAGRARTIVARVATARKLTAIAPAYSMVFVSPKLDVTDEVVRRYNAGEGREEEQIAALKAKLKTLEGQKLKPGAAPK